MLGEVLFEEKGTTSGVRVLSVDHGETTLEISLQTEGKIRGVAQNSMWTYWSKTRGDGSIYGEGKGLMTTKDGDTIQMLGSGAAKPPGADGVVHYRGAIYFRTGSKKFSDLNGAVGVHEYDVAPDGATSAKVWEWK